MNEAVLLDLAVEMAGCVDESIVCVDSDVGYFDFEANELGVPLTARNEEDVAFFFWVGKKYPKLPFIHPFVWKILHELGHFQMEWLTGDDTEDREALHARAAAGENTMLEYMELHNEKIATIWAAVFIRDNTKMCQRWSTIAEQAWE